MERDFQLILSSCPGGPGGSRTRYPPRRMHQIHLAGPWDAADDLLRCSPRIGLNEKNCRCKGKRFEVKLPNKNGVNI